MNRCKTCKWWDASDVAQGGGGLCNNDVLASGYRYDSIVFVMRKEYPIEMVWTGPEFGCVHHEEK